MYKYSRRKFINQMAMSGAMLSASSTLHALTKGINTSGTIQGKIHLFSKPFIGLEYDLMAKVLAQAGFEGIELVVRPGGNIIPENVKTDLPKAVEAAYKNGMAVDMIVTSISDADEPFTNTILETSASLGIKYYRLGWFQYNRKISVRENLRLTAQKLKKLEELNARYGIHGAYQNHYGGFIGAAIWDLYEIIKDCDPRYMGCQYDIRHAVADCGSTWETSLEIIAPWVKSIAIKDFLWEKVKGKWYPSDVILGQGMVDYSRYFSKLKELNIKAAVSLHFEHPPYDRKIINGSEYDKINSYRVAINKDICTLKGWIKEYDG